MEILSTKFIVLGFLSCCVALSGCSSEKQSSNTTLKAGKKSACQRQSGTLNVEISPDCPTSSDNLQAVSSGAGTVAWHWVKNDQKLKNENTTRLAKTHLARGDIITAIVALGDKYGTATVTIANSLPKVHSFRFTPEYIFRGQDVTVEVDGFDADGDEVTFNCKWIINDKEYPQNTLVLKGDNIKKGDKLSVIITPQDNSGTGTSFKTQTFTVSNASPRFMTEPPTNFNGDYYTYAAEARDPDGDRLVYSLATAPKGMMIDSKSGKITWQVSAAAPGSQSVEVEAQDSDGAKASQKFVVNVVP